MSTNHWMMFSTFAEQGHFAYPRVDTYHGVVLNANMVAHAPQGLASFLANKTANKRFIIDPQTHAFQHDPRHVTTEKVGEDGEKITVLKSSISKLSEHYGGVIEEHAGYSPLRPGHFNKEEIDRLSERCISFQMEQLSDRISESSDAKYLGDSAGTPCAVVAPYFFMDDITDFSRWLDINIRFVESAVQVAGGVDVFAEIVIGKGVLLDSDLRSRLVSAYLESSACGILLWVDNFDEVEESTFALAAMRDLGRRLLAGSGIQELINLHGGYFSTLLTSSGIDEPSFTGVCHGPEFGEFRGVVPVGGGIPLARYYVPKLHMRVRYPDALDLFRRGGFLESPATFFANVCACPVCREVIGDDPAGFVAFGEANPKQVRRRNGFATVEYPTKEAKERCLKHYLNCKSLEYDRCVRCDRHDLLDDLRLGLDYEEIGGHELTSHLRRWEKVVFNGDAG